jgi:cell division protein FtsL
MKPELQHYPKWLRDLIFPEINQRSWEHQKKFKDFDKALYALYTTTRNDPIGQVLFEVFLEGIRAKFEMYALQKNCDRLEEQIKELKTTIKTEKKSRKARD